MQSFTSLSKSHALSYAFCVKKLKSNNDEELWFAYFLWEDYQERECCFMQFSIRQEPDFTSTGDLPAEDLQDMVQRVFSRQYAIRQINLASVLPTATPVTTFMHLIPVGLFTGVKLSMCNTVCRVSDHTVLENTYLCSYI